MTWYNSSGWNYRKAITINNNSGSSLTGYQIKITVTFVTTKMNADFSDIRFAYDSGTDIPYWLESKTNSSTAIIWIKVNLPLYGTSPGGDNTIYMYYGKPSATSASNGNNTFDFFDDFEGSLLDGKWTVDANVTAYNVASSKVTITYVGASWSQLKGIHASFPLVNNYIVEVKDFSFSDVNVVPITIRGIGLYPASPAGWNIGNTVEVNDSWANSYGGYETYINGINGLVVSKGSLGSSGTAQFKITKDGSNYVRIYINGAEQTGSRTDPNNTTQIYLILQAYGGSYPWSGTASYDRVLARKYALPEPTVSTIGTEQTLPNITATSMTVTPRETPCRTGICIIDVSVTWTNNGGTTGSFVPSITTSNGSVAESYSSENLAPGAPTTHTFTVSGMAVGTCSICPDPN